MSGRRFRQLAHLSVIWLLTQVATANTDVEQCSHTEAAQGASQLQRASKTEQFATSRTKQFPPGWPIDAATSNTDAEVAGDGGSRTNTKEPFLPWESEPPASSQDGMLSGELEQGDAVTTAWQPEEMGQDAVGPREAVLLKGDLEQGDAVTTSQQHHQIGRDVTRLHEKGELEQGNAVTTAQQRLEMSQDAMRLRERQPREMSADFSGQASNAVVEAMRVSPVHRAQREPVATSVLHKQHRATAVKTQKDMVGESQKDATALGQHLQGTAPASPMEQRAGLDVASPIINEARKLETVKETPRITAASQTHKNATLLNQPHANPESAEPPASAAAPERESGPAEAAGHVPAEAETATGAAAAGHGEPVSEAGEALGAHGHEPSEAKAEEELKEEISLAVGVMLLGMVAFVMSIFYLVNFPDEDIRFATWNALSSCISIFCAILIFTVMKHLMMYYFGEGEGLHHAPPDSKTLSCSFIRLTVIVGLWYFMMAGLRDHGREGKDYTLKAGGVLGAHIVAFVAIDSFGNIQQLSVFRDSPVMCLVAVSIAGCAMGGFVSMFKFFRSKLNDASWHEFQEECDEGEQEAMSLTFGFLLSHFFRFCIVGHLAPLHGSPKDKTQTECFKLLFVAIVFACLTVMLSMSIQRAARGGKREAVRQLELLQDITTMTMAWCVLPYGQWQFWTATGGEGIGEGTVMTARVVMALASSAGCFTLIFIIDKIADAYPEDEQDEGGFADGCRKLLTAFVLSMALSWEAAFDRAVEGLSEQFQGSTKVRMEAFISFGLCAIVLPAWKMYILPSSIKKAEAPR